MKENLLQNLTESNKEMYQIEKASISDPYQGKPLTEDEKIIMAKADLFIAELISENPNDNRTVSVEIPNYFDYSNDIEEVSINNSASLHEETDDNFNFEKYEELLNELKNAETDNDTEIVLNALNELGTVAKEELSSNELNDTEQLTDDIKDIYKENDIAIFPDHDESKEKENDSKDTKSDVTVSSDKALENKTNIKKQLYRIRKVIYSLIVISAATILITTLWISILRVYGSSMEPSLYYDDILLVTKDSKYEQSDIIAFYYNNKILLKRVIAMPGDVVNIDEKGDVYVNNSKLDEPYKEGDSLKNSDIEYPFTVPKNQVFVLGDQREISADSRSLAIGTIPEELIIGKVGIRIWPLNRIGVIS